MPFEPPGKYAWDLWFAHDGAKQHVYYLQASKEDCDHDPENRHDLSTVGHAILENGKFTEVSNQPVFEASTTIDTWDNLSIWTGSIIKDPESNHYLFFYTSRCREDVPQAIPNEVVRRQNIGLAWSTDLLNWSRHPSSITNPLIPNPVIPNPGETEFLDGVTWRDPYVFKLGNMYHCLLTARLFPNTQYGIDSIDQGGCILAYSSNNLYDWSSSEPQIIVASKHFTQMEVPQLFWETNGDTKTFYLLFCAQTKDMSSARLDAMPKDECVSGTYIFKSELVARDSTELPNFCNETARVLVPGLYAGRVLNPGDDELQIYGFKIDPGGGAYLGGIIKSTKIQNLANFIG